MHAHWDAIGNPIPARSWEMQTFLSYGVTTMHKYEFVCARLLLLITESSVVLARIMSKDTLNAVGLNGVISLGLGYSTLAM